jgi:addiction module HigA family antidote
MAKKRKPVHPGEILREEFMRPLGLSMNRMATDLRVPVTRIADIVNERRGITADTALRFARYFKNAPGFWMNLQTRYDLEVATDEIAGKVERDVRPVGGHPGARRVGTAGSTQWGTSWLRERVPVKTTGMQRPHLREGWDSKELWKTVEKVKASATVKCEI